MFPSQILSSMHTPTDPSSSTSTTSFSSSSETTCVEDVTIPCTSISQVFTIADSIDHSIPLRIVLLDGVHASIESTRTLTHSVSIQSHSLNTSSASFGDVNPGFGVSISTQSLRVESFTITLNVSLTSPLLTIK